MIAYVWLVPYVAPYRSNAAAHGMVAVIAPPAAPLRAGGPERGAGRALAAAGRDGTALARTSGPAPAPALVVAPAAFPAALVGGRLCRGPANRPLLVRLSGPYVPGILECAAVAGLAPVGALGPATLPSILDAFSMLSWDIIGLSP